MSSLWIFVGSPVFANSHSKNDPSVQPLDKVVAIVNDDVITESELQKRIGFFKIDTNQAQIPAEEVLRTQVLNTMIDELVALQAAARAGINVDGHAVDQAIDGLLMRNHFSQKKLDALLSEQNLNFDDYRAIVHNELIVQQLLQREVGGRITIPKHEVDKYLNSLAYDQRRVNEYRLSDILIALPDAPSSDKVQAANQKAQTLLKKLKQGETFKQLAIEYSDGLNALQGGDMGWRHLEEIPTVFAEQLETMRPGEYVGPIKTANGLHILKLEQVKGGMIRQVITEHKTRHILLKVPVADEEASIKRRLLSLRKRILEGESIQQLAKQYSQDPSSAVKGGDLGWVPPGVMVPEFETVMIQQNIGDISVPVRSPFGWHLLMVEARREKDNTTAHYANQLRNKIYQRRFSEESQNFLRRLRSLSYVVNHLTPS